MKSNLSIENQAQQLVYDDEISLRDILLVLIRQRKIIFFVTLLVALASVLYALLSPPVYQVKASFFPPSYKDVAMLNMANGSNGSNGSNISRDDLYAEFEAQLNSISLRYDVFNSMGFFRELPDSVNRDDVFDRYFKSYKISKEKKKKTIKNIGMISVLLSGSDAKELSLVLNNIVNEANRRAVKKIVDGIEFTLERSIHLLEKDMVFFNEKLDVKKQDEKTVLSKTNKDAVVTPVSSEFGGLALKLEFLNHKIDTIKLLKSGSGSADGSGSAFLVKVAETQSLLTKFKSIKLDPNKISSVSIDRLAVPSDNRIKPKRSLIVAIGLLLGLILAVFLAFVVDSLQRNPLGDTNT